MEAEPLQEVKYLATDITDHELKSEKISKRDTTFLWIIVTTGSMINVFTGEATAWSSSAIPKMRFNSEENPVGRPVTPFEISMLVGIPMLAMLLGSMGYGYLSEIFGRKGSIQTAGLGIVISLVALAFSTNIICIITFRCFWNFFCQGGLTVYLVYITEISENHNRAKYGCLAGAFLPIGNFISFVFGAFLNFRNYTLAEVSPIIIFFFFICFAPESPVYSLSKNKIEECTRALKKLRSNKSEMELEADLRKINETIEASKIQKRNVPLVKLFNSKEKRYALMLAFFPILIKVCSGLGIILPYMESIFIAADTKFNSSHMPIIVAVFKFLTYFLTSFIVEKYGRRILLLISTIGSGAAVFTLGCFFYLKTINSSLIHQLQWLPLVCTIFYVILFAIGLGTIPQATMGELFTPDIRAMGVSLIYSIFAVLLFFSSVTFPYMVGSLGMNWCLWIYSSITLLGAIFLYIVYPENKGKSIIEIQNYIKSRCTR